MEYLQDRTEERLGTRPETQPDPDLRDITLPEPDQNRNGYRKDRRNLPSSRGGEILSKGINNRQGSRGRFRAGGFHPPDKSDQQQDGEEDDRSGADDAEKTDDSEKIFERSLDGVEATDLESRSYEEPIRDAKAQADYNDLNAPDKPSQKPESSR